MFIIKLLQMVADSKPLLIAAFLSEVFSMFIMLRRSEYLMNTFGGGLPPDLWIGVPEEKFFNYLSEVGPGGRAAYQKMNSWDFFPYMPSYMLLYGALLLIQCRSAQANNLSWVFFVAMLFDIIETVIFNYATKQFPNRISSTIVRVASIANEMKWVCVGFGTIILVGLFVYNSLKRAKSKSHQQ